MKIDKFELKNDLILAPMAGYTDFAFRYLCKTCGVGLTVSEMVSSKGLLYDSEKTKELLIKNDIESPVSAQIFGNDADCLAEVCNHEVLKPFDIIDINMGCPAPKIIKNGDGSALLLDIKKAEKIITTCVKKSPKPITVKFRIGFNEKNIVTTEFAKMCEASGASCIAIHGRTTNQGYSGTVNYDEIKKAKEAVKIPVIANGDVCSKEDYLKVKKMTNCDGVMVGRGALGNPFIFCDILGLDKPFTRFEALEKHYKMLLEQFEEKFVLLNMRKHLAHYIKGGLVTVEEKQNLLRSENIYQILEFCKVKM